MIIDNYDKNSKDTQNKLFAFDVKVMKQLKKAGLWDWELEEKFWLKYGIKSSSKINIYNRLSENSFERVNIYKNLYGVKK